MYHSFTEKLLKMRQNIINLQPNNLIITQQQLNETPPFAKQMIQQFQKLLQTPKPTPQTYLKMTQDQMLNTMQQLMPDNFDFTQLARLFQHHHTDAQTLPSLTFKLTQFFTKVVAQNFISLQAYFALEEQTQKLQSTIRGHIKMEQEMKMYLQHLEYKIERYEYHLKRLRRKHNNQGSDDKELKEFCQKQTIDQLKKRQTQLLKQRLVLLRKVDHLQRKLKDHQTQLRRLNSPTSATIQQIKQGVNRQRKASQVHQQRVAEIQGQTIVNNNNTSAELLLKPSNQIDRRMSTHSFNSDHQITQKKTSIPVNSFTGNRMYPLTGKDQFAQHQQNGGLLTINQVETKTFIQLDERASSSRAQDNTVPSNRDYEELGSPIDHLIKVD